MEDIDVRYDELLKIHTTGRDDSISNLTNFPYEPSPYEVLLRLYNSGYIKKNNTLLDYGCGKGRVDFYLSYQTKCHTIGVEYNERLYNKALMNKESGRFNRSEFVLKRAEEYQIDNSIDRFYFFNPFNLKVLNKVILNIIDSYDKSNRETLLFFYYPSDKYENYLNKCMRLELLDSISTEDLYNNGDIREKILVYKLV
ncbi:MAG: class I SAM-dependent methyltransferase [Acholeplasmatales bacterium]|nr:class I SAM-dependent methyltransferase [Acholeplasmatales bacterium]